MAKGQIKAACERLAVLSDTLEKISSFDYTSLIREDAEVMKKDTSELADEIDYEDGLEKVKLTPIEDVRNKYNEDKKAYFQELQKEIGEWNVVLE